MNIGAHEHPKGVKECLSSHTQAGYLISCLLLVAPMMSAASSGIIIMSSFLRKGVKFLCLMIFMMMMSSLEHVNPSY